MTWISPPWAEETVQHAKSGATEVSGSRQGQWEYTKEDKERFRKNPAEHLAYRKELEGEFNDMFEVFLRGSDASHRAQERMESEMLRRIGPGHEELKKRLLPTRTPGCRRLKPGEWILGGIGAEKRDSRASGHIIHHFGGPG
jgi:hypothetical protein